MSEAKNQITNNELEGLLSINNLDYQHPSQSVVAKGRSLIKSNFNKTKYVLPLETATCYLSYGDAYVDPSMSYLMFNIRVTNDTESLPGGTAQTLFGSALNIIDTISLTGRSGTQIERVSGIGLMKYHTIPWENTLDKIDRPMSAFQHSYLGTTQAEYNDVKNTDNQTVCIPLSELGLGCFKPDGGKLLPSKITAGMRVDITFNDNWTSFVHNADASGKANTYSVENLAFVMDSVVLSDPVLHAMNKQASSKQGIPLTWKSTDLTQNTVTTGKDIHVSAKNALSLVTRAMVVLVKTSATNADKTTDNRLNSLQDKWTSQQFRYGSHFYPNQKLTQSSCGSEIEFYQNGLYVTKGVHGNLSTSFADFKQSVVAQDTYCSKPAWVSLESNHLADLPGVPTSSGRSLDFDGSIATASSFDVNFFVEYVTRCNIFSSKIVVTE
jgi:hypothetical protein